MKLEFRMEYFQKVYSRYKRVTREVKGKILDELCHVCGFNRKYAIWKLKQGPADKNHPKARLPRAKTYDSQVMRIIEAVWKAANYPWTLRLKEILRLWLPWIRRHFPMTQRQSESSWRSAPARSIGI